MNNHKSHRFIATASSAAVSLTMLVAAGALAQESAPAGAVTEVTAPAGSAPSSSATQLQARIIDVSGKARWRSSPDAEWKDAAVNDDLSPGAEVRTGMRSRVTLRFRNATVLVDSSTNFAIPTIEQEGDVLRTIAAVRSGRADFKVDKVGLQNDFKVVTPSTTLAVRGTSFATVTGPLKGVEIVGSRDNAIRAIEVRYAALNQTVEMSGGSEAKSTSETPNPTEHALGTTFNVPQAGMIASKEEAQQGALAGSSAPQTQRQSTTTVAAVTQVKQDIAAAERGEGGGSSNLSLLIDIARAAGLRSAAQDAGALQAEALSDVLAIATEARARFAELDSASTQYTTLRQQAEAALGRATTALGQAQAAVSTAVGSSQSVVDTGNAAFQAFVANEADAALRSRVDLAASAAQAGSSAAGAAPGIVGSAQGELGDASARAALLPGLATQFSVARAAIDAAAVAAASPGADVNQLRDLVVQANAAVQALVAGRNVPQLQQAAIDSAQAAVAALQRAVDAGAARNEIAANALIALQRADYMVGNALSQQIQSSTAAIATVQSRLAEATQAAAQAQSHADLLDAAIESMLVARSGADEAAAAATAANEFRGLVQGRQVAAQAAADFAVAVGALVNNDRLDALREMNAALDALENSELHAAATAALANEVSIALSQESPDLNAAGVASAGALAKAVLAQVEADNAGAASQAANAAADTAAGRVAVDSSFAQSESTYNGLVAAALVDVAGAGTAETNAVRAAGAASDGAGLASGLGTQLASAFGGSDAAAAITAAQQLAANAAERRNAAQTAYLAAQGAYSAAVAAGRSSAEVTVWNAVRTLASQARTDADTALAAAVEAQRVASFAMAQALAAEAAVEGAGFPVLAQLSRDAADSAKASAFSGMSDVLALVQAHQQVLDESGAAVAQALATLGSSLAATEVAQNSASGVAQRLGSVRNAIFEFMAIDDAGDPSNSQVSDLLNALLNARNEALGLALAAGAGAADAGAVVAAHAQSVAATDAAGAQGQAAAVQAILEEAAAALGTDVNDPRLALMRALRDRAAERADAAEGSAGETSALAAQAAQPQADARAALAALGIVPAWGIGDVAGSFGSDVEGAAAAAAAAAVQAAQASEGASVLIAVHGAAQSADSSITASEQGVAAANEARLLATDAANVARSAAAQIADGNSSARSQALAAIAEVRDQVAGLQAQSGSGMASAAGRLDTLLAQLSSGTVNVSDASASLADALALAGAARENADVAGGAGAIASGISAEFAQLVASLGVGGTQAQETLQQIEAAQLVAAESLRQLANSERAQVDAFVASIVAAAAAGDSVTMDDLAFAAAWLRQVTLEEYQSLQAAIAAAEGARDDAQQALTQFQTASAGATQPVVNAAQDAVDAADAFLRQVVALQVEVALGHRALDAEVARGALASLQSQVASRAADVSLTVGAMRGAIADYESATASMAASVAAAHEARAQAVERLSQLEQSFASSDSRLAALRAHLVGGNRSEAGIEGGLISAAAGSAGSLAQQADSARASALSALSGLDGLGTAAGAALVRMDGEVSGAAVHQVALAWQQEQVEDARDDALASADGVAGLVEEAGSVRGTALGAHALDASGDALLRASNALAGITNAGVSLTQALGEAGAVNRQAAGITESQANELRDWASSLDYGSSSIPTLIADQVVAVSGVAQGAIGAYDARVAAVAARQEAELAQGRAVAAEYVSFGALESHQAAMVGVNQEHGVALEQRGVAAFEWLSASLFRLETGYWMQQTLNYVESSDATSAAWAAGSANEGASEAENAAGRAGIAATLAEAAGGRALEWARISATAFQTANAAASDAEQQRDAAVTLAGDVTIASGAATAFAAAAEQFAAIAATAAAGDASEFARQARDQAVAQIVLAESARDAAQAAALNARTHANKIVFGAVAAKANQTVQLATQARDFAHGAMEQAAAARIDANTAIAAASSVGGGTN